MGYDQWRMFRWRAWNDFRSNPDIKSALVQGSLNSIERHALGSQSDCGAYSTRAAVAT